MTITRSATALIAIAALAGIGLAGCGGSDGPSTAATSADGANAEPRMTVDAYRAAADAVCTKAVSDLASAPALTDVASVRAYADTAIAAGQDGIDGLSGLYPPADLEAAHVRLIAGEQEALDLTKALSARLTDATTPADLGALMGEVESPNAQRIEADITAAAADLGLSACGSTDWGTLTPTVPTTAAATG